MSKAALIVEKEKELDTVKQQLKAKAEESQANLALIGVKESELEKVRLEL